MGIFPQLRVQLCQVDSLNSVTAGVFAPQKLASTTSHASLPAPENQLLNIYQHTSGLTSPSLITHWPTQTPRDQEVQSYHRSVGRESEVFREQRE